MKKLISVILVLAVVVAMSSVFVSCTKTPPATYELALVTDVGNIDDKSFNEGAWNGVKEYAETNKKSYAYYRPSEDSTEARMETIKTAISKGAKMVVCPGYLFEEAIYNLQDLYPTVSFMLLDGEPHTADYVTYKTADNTHCILYREEQAGYLAGYASIKDGFRKLGFMGGMAVPAVIRYGYGFIQGAEAAATELALADGAVTMNYWYSGDFKATDENKTKMSAWYSAGTEVVFACGGPVYQNAVAAAQESTNKFVIGVDVDQSAQSDLIITSAMKELKESVKISLAAFYANNETWDADYAGKTATLGAAENCVGLPTAEDSWKFETFTVAEYETLFAKVKDGTIAIDNASDKEVHPTTVKVVVDYQG
ncbi:MAG TPA: BMP family ABC transporter substrate-binding protein [Clostridia bacterium]|nr:BMP family ABC transporter substrate-binding protein [Clostridia bacterium]